MKPVKRTDYVKLVERLSSQNPHLAGYLANRIYINQLSASLYLNEVNSFLRRTKVLK